jgi:hypothetical protein
MQGPRLGNPNVAQLAETAGAECGGSEPSEHGMPHPQMGFLTDQDSG